MKNVLKQIVGISLLLVGTSIIAGNAQTPQIIDHSINSVAIAKQETSVNRIACITGTLIKNGKKYYLQDSTDKIPLIIPKSILKTVDPMVGQNVKITGKVSNILWKNAIIVSSIEVFK